jgi:ABC-2 type transport system ATP-binding protein
MCDRVTILRQGEAVVSGEIRTLLRGDVLRTDIFLASLDEKTKAALEEAGFPVAERPGVAVVAIEGEARVGEVLRLALDGGARVVEVAPRKETLEDLFMRRAL